MALVPHSGNLCSGLCAPPCPHLDCWQCNVEREHRDRKTLKAKLLKAKLEAEFTKMKAEQKSLLGQLPAQGPKDHQKATITRAALEGLVARAGMSMDWNNGDPVIKEGYYASPPPMSPAKSLADSVASMDKMVKDILSGKIAETLRKPLPHLQPGNFNAEQPEPLMSPNATEEDLEAAKKLFGWKDPAEKPEVFDGGNDFWLDPGRVQAMLNVWSQQHAMGVLSKEEFLRIIDSEMANISGLNELLKSPPIFKISTTDGL